MRIAIGNFQTVYGLNKTGAMNQTTLSKLQLVDGFRNRAMNILAENENNVITHHDPDYVYDVNDEKRLWNNAVDILVKKTRIIKSGEVNGIAA